MKLDLATNNLVKKGRFKSIPLEPSVEEEESHKINPHALFRTDGDAALDAAARLR